MPQLSDATPLLRPATLRRRRTSPRVATPWLCQSIPGNTVPSPCRATPWFAKRSYAVALRCCASPLPYIAVQRPATALLYYAMPSPCLDRRRVTCHCLAAASLYCAVAVTCAVWLCRGPAVPCRCSTPHDGTERCHGAAVQCLRSALDYSAMPQPRPAAPRHGVAVPCLRLSGQGNASLRPCRALLCFALSCTSCRA